MDLNTVNEIVRPGGRDQFPRWQDGDAWLGGGTWLYSEPQPSLTRLIDLAALRWPAIETDAAGLRIAATCTVAHLAAAALPAHWTAASLIGPCCNAFVASFKIWNTATVGGNICLALPAGPMISLAVALDATAVLWPPEGGERRMPAIDFVTGQRTTALRPGEILRQIEIPAAALTRRAAFRQISLTPHGRSAALLIGTLASDSAFDLTVTAATARPVRISFDALPDAAGLSARIATGIAGSLYFDDVHGAAEWRRHVTPILAEEIRRELAGAAA